MRVLGQVVSGWVGGGGCGRGAGCLLLRGVAADLWHGADGDPFASLGIARLLLLLLLLLLPPLGPSKLLQLSVAFCVASVRECVCECVSAMRQGCRNACTLIALKLAACAIYRRHAMKHLKLLGESLGERLGISRQLGGRQGIE